MKSLIKQYFTKKDLKLILGCLILYSLFIAYIIIQGKKFNLSFLLGLLLIIPMMPLFNDLDDYMEMKEVKITPNRKLIDNIQYIFLDDFNEKLFMLNVDEIIIKDELEALKLFKKKQKYSLYVLQEQILLAVNIEYLSDRFDRLCYASHIICLLRDHGYIKQHRLLGRLSFTITSIGVALLNGLEISEAINNG